MRLSCLRLLISMCIFLSLPPLKAEFWERRRMQISVSLLRLKGKQGFSVRGDGHDEGRGRLTQRKKSLQKVWNNCLERLHNHAFFVVPSKTPVENQGCASFLNQTLTCGRTCKTSTFAGPPLNPDVDEEDGGSQRVQVSSQVQF